MVMRYRSGDPMYGVSVRRLWRAKYLYESTYDTVTDKKALFLGRPASFVPMSAIIDAAMVIYNRRLQHIALCQLAQQTFQSCINYVERPHTAIITDMDLLAGYISGSVGGIFAACTYKKMFQYSNIFIRDNGPLIGIIMATCFCIPVMRNRELREGILIEDQNEVKLGYSTRAARVSVLADMLKQLIVTIPHLDASTIMSTYYLRFLDIRRSKRWRYRMNFPYQVIFIGLFCTFATPFLRAIMPEKGYMPFCYLRKELQDCIKKSTGLSPEWVYFRLDMSPT